MIVVDASTIAAVIFNEPGSEIVSSTLEKNVLMAPSLLPYEIANVALKKIETYPDQNVQLYDILKLFDNMLIDYVQIPAAGMVDVANQTDLSSYDAAYLWLSLELRVPLVTLDKELNTAAHRLGIKIFDMFE